MVPTLKGGCQHRDNGKVIEQLLSKGYAISANIYISKINSVLWNLRWFFVDYEGGNVFTMRTIIPH